MLPCIYAAARRKVGGQQKDYWQLVESCRSQRGPRQRVVAHLGDEPRKVFDEIAQIQMVDVVLPTKSGVNIRRRCVAQPTKHQAILLQKLGLTLPTHLETHDM
jgi:hypothetical protein